MKGGEEELGMTLDFASRAAEVDLAESGDIGDTGEACELNDDAATETVAASPDDAITRDVSEGTLDCDCS